MCEGRWPDPAWISGFELALNAGLLFYVAQFTDEEHGLRIGYGHSSYRHALEFAALAKVREIVSFHHDPSHDNTTLDRLLADSVQKLKPACKVSPGREGAVFELKSK